MALTLAETPKTPAERLIESDRYPLRAAQGVQASRLLDQEEALRHLHDQLPNYGELAAGESAEYFDDTRDASQGKAPGAPNATVTFDALTAERTELNNALLTDQSHVQVLINKLYDRRTPDAARPPLRPDAASILTQFIDATSPDRSYQATFESLSTFEPHLFYFLQNATARLRTDSATVPTDEELADRGESRGEVRAQFEEAVTTLEDAYGRLRTFLIRAQALHTKVLPAYRERSLQCAATLEKICTDATADLWEEPEQFFGTGNESQNLPQNASDAFHPLRVILRGLRTTEGLSGIPSTQTIPARFIEGYVQHALSEAKKEHSYLEEHADKVLLTEFDQSLAPKTDAPHEAVATVEPSTDVQSIGRGFFRKLRTQLAGLLNLSA